MMDWSPKKNTWKTRSTHKHAHGQMSIQTDRLVAHLVEHHINSSKLP